MTTIHIVEDDALMSDLLKTLLSLEGYDVVIDNDYERLGTNLRESKPDIVLIDVNLRGFNGLEIIRRFREESPDQKISIIAQSGLDQRQLALSSGANEFILKPYACDDLIDMLKDLGQK